METWFQQKYHIFSHLLLCCKTPYIDNSVNLYLMIAFILYLNKIKETMKQQANLKSFNGCQRWNFHEKVIFSAVNVVLRQIWHWEFLEISTDASHYNNLFNKGIKNIGHQPFWEIKIVQNYTIKPLFCAFSDVVQEILHWQILEKS